MAGRLLFIIFLFPSSNARRCHQPRGRLRRAAPQFIALKSAPAETLHKHRVYALVALSGFIEAVQTMF